MAKVPSKRRNAKQEEMELNLTPMMNLIAILIPCLLISVAFVEVAVISVAAPSIGPSGPSDAPVDVPLNLKVTITEKGYLLTSSIPDVFGTSGASLGIPTQQKPVSCVRYADTAPPPRSVNQGLRCQPSDTTRNFTVYDPQLLTSTLMGLKERFPGERRIIVAAEKLTEFEAIADVLDASRTMVDPTGTEQPLFDEVVFSPASQ